MNFKKGNLEFEIDFFVLLIVISGIVALVSALVEWKRDFIMINKNNKTICDRHTNILNIAEDCCRMKFSEESAQESFNYLIDKMDDIYRLTREALDDGQNMEDRLDEYRTAIESLGFERVKK